MVVHKFFLYGAVEPLTMSVHLGSFGVSVPMYLVQCPNLLIKVFHELRAVIGQILTLCGRLDFSLKVQGVQDVCGLMQQFQD